MQITGKRVVQAILFILIIGAFIYIGSKDYGTKQVADNERFKEEYPNISADNVFKYVSSKDVYAILKNGSGIIFMGYHNNAWSGYYANILNDIAKSLGIKEISYYDFYDDRKVSNATYESIVLKLKNYLPMLDDETQDIYAPTLVVVKNGNIIYYDAETSINKGLVYPNEYWTQERINNKKDSLVSVFINYNLN